MESKESIERIWMFCDEAEVKYNMKADVNKIREELNILEKYRIVFILVKKKKTNGSLTKQEIELAEQLLDELYLDSEKYEIK